MHNVSRVQINSRYEVMNLEHVERNQCSLIPYDHGLELDMSEEFLIKNLTKTSRK